MRRVAGARRDRAQAGRGEASGAAFRHATTREVRSWACICGETAGEIKGVVKNNHSPLDAARGAGLWGERGTSNDSESPPGGAW